MPYTKLYRNEPGMTTLVDERYIDSSRLSGPIDYHRDILHTPRPMPATPVEAAPRMELSTPIPYDIGLPNRGSDHT